MPSSTLRLLVDGFFFLFSKFFFTSSLWLFSYSNLFIIFGKWSRWIGFIHIASLWWQPLYFTRYSLPLSRVCLARNMFSILVAILCLTTLISDCTLCFQSSLCSSHKNSLSFKTWKVRCATKLVGNFKVYTSRCGLVKSHKVLRTWQWNMGLIYQAS
jgi:hypothetical protein